MSAKTDAKAALYQAPSWNRETDMDESLTLRSEREDIWIQSGRGWLGNDFQPGLVSIIVPIFNAEGTLLETLQSVYSQNFRPIELVLVDDGSADKSVTLAEEFASLVVEGASSFSVNVLTQANGGAPKARNRGARSSRGEFVVFLDADDMLDPEKIGRQVSALEKNSDWDFCYGPVAILEESNRRPYGNCLVDWRSAALRQLSWPLFSTLGPVLRRHFINRVGQWDEDLTACQDWELHSRMVMLRPKFGWVDDAIAYYRQSVSPARRLSVRNFKRRRAPETVLRQRERQLRSLLAHAPECLLRSSDFRRTASWEVIRLARTEANSGMLPSALRLYTDARSLSCGTVVFPLAALAFKLCSFGRARSAGWLISLFEWVFYRCTAAISRLKRRVRITFCPALAL
jgi:glycosyltransferase involved in cell wall biosynthesis